MLYGAAMRQGDPDWLGWVNTCFTVAMYGHQNEIYDAALEEFFGVKPPDRKPGFPRSEPGAGQASRRRARPPGGPPASWLGPIDPRGLSFQLHATSGGISTA